MFLLIVNHIKETGYRVKLPYPLSKIFKARYKHPPEIQETNTDTTGQVAINPMTRSKFSLFNVLRLLGIILFYGSPVAYAAYNTPFAWKAFNSTTRFLGFQPVPTHSSETKEKESTAEVDSFFELHTDMKQIKRTISNHGINFLDLDLNDNGIVFDSNEEVYSLRKKLLESSKESKDSATKNLFTSLIDELDRVETMDNLVWGYDGPDPYNLSQANRPNCQVMGAIQSHLFDVENIQSLKKTIHVTNFVSSNGSFRIDVEIHLNGKVIQVPFEDLVKWMSIENIQQSFSIDNSLFIPYLTRAIEKEVEVPNAEAGSPITVLTDKDYIAIPITGLTDEVLINILTKAPNTPTLITTHSPLNEVTRDLTFNDIIDYWKKVLFNKAITTKYTYSPQAAESFIMNTKQLTQDIQTSIKIEPKKRRLGPKVWRMPRIKSTPDELLTQHVYAVKEVKNLNGESIVTALDSHGYEFNLKLKDIRKHIDSVVSLSNNFPAITNKSISSIAFALLFISALEIARRKIKKPKEQV